LTLAGAELLLVAALSIQAEPVAATPEWTPPVLHATALFTLVRQAEAALYPLPFADGNLKHIGEHYKDTFTMPPLFESERRFFEWDRDSWTINVIGHGLMGSELYLRARTCHFSLPASLAFAAGASAVWEYVVEGNGVRPSALDLVYTPLGGMLWGELRYIGYRSAQAIGNAAPRKILSAIFDPFGELERRSLGSPC
jgi:hypothetical protein